MADPPQIPSPYAVLTPAIDAIVAARPNALPIFNGGTGRWAHLVTGWRAQAALNFERLADEAQSARLPLASGDALRQLCASEFETTVSSDAAPAIGSLVLTRSTGTLHAGTIRIGDVFPRLADPTAKPVPIQGMEYEAIQPVYVPQGQLTATVYIRAKRTGLAGNIVQEMGVANTSIALPPDIFDPAFAVTACYAGGGADAGFDEKQLARAAKRNARGQFGPIENALISSVLTAAGVRHDAYFDYEPTHPVGALAVALSFIADGSWGSSPDWAMAVTQAVQDRVGFGCRHTALWVSNIFSRVSLNVRLKKTQDLFDTTGLQDIVRKAAQAYFNDRPDWYHWSEASLRAAITRADPRILVCSSAFLSAYASAAGIPESPFTSVKRVAPGLFGPSNELVHYFVPDDGVVVTFLPPT